MSYIEKEISVIALQKAAFQAAEYSAMIGNRYDAGEASETEYLLAMEAVEIIVEHAVKCGMSYKDLPAI